MRSLIVAVCLIGSALTAFAQSDRGTITGTIADPAGAVVANAAIEVRNVEVGAQYQVGSTATGNYTVQVPAGRYELTVNVPGFKKYVRPGIVVPVAQTLRLDVILEIGSNTESVTVTEATPLLKTESGELSHNVTSDSLNSLPVLGIGSANVGATGIRSPYSVMNLIPGAAWLADNTMRVNGQEGNSSALRVEGQDATPTIALGQTSQTQPSVEATQEVAVQTSNYAAEFGQAGGGLFNFTMKSGTNQFHGSAYDYFVNEALNAGTPFTNDGQGHLLRPRQRRNDYGFSVGGPVRVPKMYDGHNKTFFFVNWEQFRENTIINNFPTVVPTVRYRKGDFGQALTGRNLGKDGLGRALLENTIYDPLTEQLINGVRYRDPYPNNIIPLTNIDPVALKIQEFIPQPSNSGLTNNYVPAYSNSRVSSVPSIKLDHSLSSQLKLSGYWSRTQTNSPNNSGLDYPISVTIGSHVKADTYRVNVDYILRPTLLLHIGGGYLYSRSDPDVPRFDNSTIGFKGTNTDLFPYFSVLSQAQGGMTNFGPPSDFRIKNLKSTGTISLTWVHDNHTYKVGGELIVNGYPSFSETYSAGNMLYNAAQTGLPSLDGVSLPASVGFNYASFLLGSPNTGYDSVPAAMRTGNHSLAGFVQDSWKVTRKLTIDYGLRYDFQTYLKEHNGYMFNVSAETPNPSAGGRLGAIIFEGYGGGRCNCAFAHNYPWAFQPRLGLAYQIDSKTVLRIGAGISYSKTSNDASKASNFGSTKPFAPPEYGTPPFTLAGGIPYQITFPDFNPGQQPLPGTVGNPTNMVDRNAGRPARIWQWSIGLQRELSRNLVVEASYVGNRGVWWAAQTLSPFASNGIPDYVLAANGLSLDNAADRNLLKAPINSALAASRGFSTPPYPGFPLGLTVAQTLRPIPQFTGIVQTWTPLGNTWYDALQAKATKRFSHGLDAVVTYTYSKSLALGAEENNNYGSTTTPVINDVFNRQNNKTLSGFDQPQTLIIAGNYTTPKIFASGSGFANKLVSWAARDWTAGAVLRYASGFPIKVPFSTTGLNTYIFQNTLVNRVPGEPFFTEDLNCHCFDPNTTFVLNPKAWANPPLGQFGTANAHYNDYRMARRPSESVSLARNFRFSEQANLQIRAEFSNIFNRAGINVPTATNAFATQTRDKNGQTTGGFGYISSAAVGGAASNPAAASGASFATPRPREGTIVVRLQF
jgi:Carboxypeptidase regulatory-like domain